MELLHKDIISRGDMMTIKRTADPIEQNQFLHFCLKQKCTEEAFKTVCKVFKEVEGNPKMRALGDNMRRMLETGGLMKPLLPIPCLQQTSENSITSNRST